MYIKHSKAWETYTFPVSLCYNACCYYYYLSIATPAVSIFNTAETADAYLFVEIIFM